MVVSRALPALRADSSRSTAVRLLARAVPPNLPRATAAGFFFFMEGMLYAYFQCRKGWHVQFLESDLKTPLRKRLTFAHEHKVVELAERGGGGI